MYSKAVTEDHRGGSLVATAGTRWHYVALSVVLSTCSMLSKEQGITALGVCAGFDVLLHWEAVWSTLLKTIRSITNSSESPKLGNGKALATGTPTKETRETSQCTWLVARRLGIAMSLCYCIHCCKQTFSLRRCANIIRDMSA